MFAQSMGAGVNFGFPDVCLTPIGPAPVPIPYPNIEETATSAPAAYNVLMDCMPAINQLSFGLVSEGDEPGVEMGLISHIESGQSEYLVGCITILTDGVPQQRLTSVTGQNCMAVLPNAPGMNIAPSQVTVLTLG